MQERTQSPWRVRPSLEYLEDRCGLTVVAGVTVAPPDPATAAHVGVVALSPFCLPSLMPATSLDQDEAAPSLASEIALDDPSIPEDISPGAGAEGPNDSTVTPPVDEPVQDEAVVALPSASVPVMEREERPENICPNEADGAMTTAAAETTLPQLSAHSPVVPLSLTSGTPENPLPTSGAGLVWGAPPTQKPDFTQAFCIRRTPLQGEDLQVRYLLTAYTGDGTTIQERTTILPAGDSFIRVPGLLPAKAREPEIVTLTLQENTYYQIGKRTATLFLLEDSRQCSEAALLQAYRQGMSGEAFSTLVEIHRPTVLRICQNILGNLADAEDVSQNVFLLLARKQVRLQTNLGRWLYTVARNAAISYLRSRQRRVHHEYLAARAEAVSPDNAPHLPDDEVQQALTKLPRQLRQAVELRYLEGRSQQEAAQLLGCPRGTLSQRAARGILHLRGLLCPDTTAT
jgi:RNA polymerase sigma factor (sigma-70 family)